MRRRANLQDGGPLKPLRRWIIRRANRRLVPLIKRAAKHVPAAALLAATYVHHFFSQALAHGVGGQDEERLNVALVVLSFALIGAFVFVATQKRGRAGGNDF